PIDAPQARELVVQPLVPAGRDVVGESTGNGPLAGIAIVVVVAVGFLGERFAHDRGLIWRPHRRSPSRGRTCTRRKPRPPPWRRGSRLSRCATCPSRRTGMSSEPARAAPRGRSSGAIAPPAAATSSRTPRPRSSPGGSIAPLAAYWQPRATSATPFPNQLQPRRGPEGYELVEPGIGLRSRPLHFAPSCGQPTRPVRSKTRAVSTPRPGGRPRLRA